MSETNSDMKAKLAEFAARFTAKRREEETKKRALKTYLNSKERFDVEERKGSNRAFHMRNVPLPGGTAVSSHEDANRLAMLRKQDDLNWEPLSVVVTGQWQECRCCGHQAIATSGFYFRERHKTIASARRLREIKNIPDGWKVEVNVEGVILQQCVKCVNGTLVDDIFSTLLHGGELRVSNQMELFRS
jgi:hypothetical protein